MNYLKTFSILAFAVVCYTGLFIYCLLDRPTLGVDKDSKSKLDSKKDGFYIGEYTPKENILKLGDLFVVEFSNAWIEYAWKAEFSWYFKDHKKRSLGYFIHIPLRTHQLDGFTSNVVPSKILTFRLSGKDTKYTKLSGISYESTPEERFTVYVDEMPDAISFEMQGKQSSDVTQNISFRRVIVQ